MNLLKIFSAPMKLPIFQKVSKMLKPALQFKRGTLQRINYLTAK